MSSSGGPMPVFTGRGEPPKDPQPDAWSIPEPYVASPDLKGAVNMALRLGRPLLLEGEPGSGKTRLAFAVAYELGYPLKTIYVRSTSRAQDLLYTFDAVRRLYDIHEQTAARWGPAGAPIPHQAGAPDETDASDEGEQKAAAMRQYVELGKLGEAIELSQRNIPSVVLIDEIDKADIDFPNDLLQAVERLEFDVSEARLHYDAMLGQRREDRLPWLPLVIVTSNREKELPAPFLRRCLFAYIPFPSDEQLREILARQIALEEGDEPLIAAAVDKFLELRRQSWFSWRKSPGTSELLDWVKALRHGVQGESVSAKERFAEELRAQPIGAIDHPETLVKTQSDRDSLAMHRSPAVSGVTDG